MNKPWNVADAKSRFSELLNQADHDSPQVIHRRDTDYVLMTGEQYRLLTGKVPDFLDYLINHGPKTDKLEPMPRQKTAMREVDL